MNQYLFAPTGRVGPRLKYITPANEFHLGSHSVIEHWCCDFSPISLANFSIFDTMVNQFLWRYLFCLRDKYYYEKIPEHYLLGKYDILSPPKRHTKCSDFIFSFDNHNVTCFVLPKFGLFFSFLVSSVACVENIAH